MLGSDVLVLLIFWFSMQIWNSVGVRLQLQSQTFIEFLINLHSYHLENETKIGLSRKWDKNWPVKKGLFVVRSKDSQDLGGPSEAPSFLTEPP